jgi:hypothetical protein
MSGFWDHAFRLLYRILALIDPLVRGVWRHVGVGNTVDVTVARRNGKGDRSRLLGLLRVGNRRYLGHPNGQVGWTRDVEAAGGGTYRWPGASATPFTATKLVVGPEREAAIKATWQHPFPANIVYRLGRRHVRKVGVFFRLETDG